MALILFDTNIFIDMLGGCKQGTIELSSYDFPAISAVTYMELRAGQMLRPHEKPILDVLLAEFEVIQIDQMVMERAIEIRGTSLVTGPKVKLPDAIIGATAAAYRMPIVTRNPKDFQWEGIDVHVPYDYDSTTGAVTNVRPAFTAFKPKPTLTRIR
jgi:predicted nucleic acid-binding protein